MASKGEKLDTTEFVAALNGDLKTEYQSIVQYINHIALLKGAEYLSIIDELKIHLTQELTHALVLAEQVAFLGGEPSCHLNTVVAAHAADKASSALHADLDLERDQLDRYRERFAQANELGLADVAEA